MCGLYSFRKSPEETRTLFDYLDQPDFPPRQFVTPGSPMAIVRMQQGARHFALVRWGFIPSWANEPQPGKPLINARAETVAEKPTFRNAFRRRRCLIPADGFYEWAGDVPGKKQPWYIRRRDDGLMAFAGLWEPWMGANGSELETGVIITTDANAQVGTFHTRSPVVIAPDDFTLWLEGDADKAAKLLHPAADNMWQLEQAVIPRSAPPPKPVPETPRDSQMKLL